MKLIDTKCPYCGADIKINPEAESLTCRYCGSNFNVEEALASKKENSRKHKEIATKEPDEPLKLECDLLLWHNFFGKCNEVERSFYVLDEEAKVEKKNDIVERKLNYDFGKFFEENILSEFDKRYVKEHNLNNGYEERISCIERINTDSIYEEGKRRKWFWGFFVLTALSLLLFIIFLATGIVLHGVFSPAAQTFAVLHAVFLLSSIISFVRLAKQCEINEHYSIRIPTFQEYFAEVKNGLEYKKEKAACRQNFIKKAKKDSVIIEDRLPELREIKADIVKVAPLPARYTNEKDVDALLALVLDKRADTLKDAINLLETEKYRREVTLSLDVLNENIVQLNRGISSLKETSIIGFSAMLKQNQQINEKLQRIAVTNTSLAIDSIFRD